MHVFYLATILALAQLTLLIVFFLPARVVNSVLESDTKTVVSISCIILSSKREGFQQSKLVRSVIIWGGDIQNTSTVQSIQLSNHLCTRITERALEKSSEVESNILMLAES